MPSVEKLVEETVAYLGSQEALESVRLDPYWPKWDSPWWRMTLLWELGLAARIPASIAGCMAERIDEHYFHGFPTKDYPAGLDPRTQILCPCAIGTIMQVLQACGLSPSPWLER